MSADPDPAELAPSRDPAAYGRRPLFTAGFFAWVLVCVLCVGAGVAIGRFGLTAAPSAKPETPALETPRAAPVAPALAAVAPPANPASAAAEDDTALVARVGRLEAASGHANAAAAQALGAAALSQASQGPAPFEADLAAYQRLAPGDANLVALAPLAARGAPSRATLGSALPDLLAQASIAAHHPAKDASLIARAAALLARVVIVRHVDPAAPGVDGVLARAEDAADAGDLESAVAGLEALPPAARAPLDAWLAAAHRRLEIDRRVEALRAEALAALAQSGGVRS
jgi:hypothetical protein